jgi:hypothetical protein
MMRWWRYSAPSQALRRFGIAGDPGLMCIFGSISDKLLKRDVDFDPAWLSGVLGNSPTFCFFVAG